MKRIIAAIFIAYACLLGQSATAQQSIVQLKWKLAPQADSVYKARQVASAGFSTDSWINAIVPGTVFYSYVAAGKESDPDYAENIYKVDKAKYNKPYWYRTEFSAVSFPAGKRIWLNFFGINKRGEVYFNGQHIGTVDGLVQRCNYDITSLLNKSKPNAIAVLVFTPRTDHSLANREAPTYLSSGSWDWMPSVPGLNSGITDVVTITATGPVTIEDPWIRTDLLDKSLANLVVKVKLNNNNGQPVTGKLKVTINPGNITITTPSLTLTGNSSRAVELNDTEYPQLSIKDPELWWPNGYGGRPDGTQYLYTCSVKFDVDGDKTSDGVTKSFGIRKISADTTALNGPLRVYVNDVPVLIKGGNWGMSDYMLKVRGKDYETRIRFHQAMNFNMIRNWTGEVTDEAFYDYCDKYGIMVWDDFWLNNFGGIDSLGVFKSNAVEKVKRLRDHPAVVIWCGANEGVPGGNPKGPLNMAIEDAVKDNDGDDRLYLPRSNAGVNNPNFSAHGGSRILSGSGIWGNVDAKTYFTDPHNGYLFSKDNYGLRSELGKIYAAGLLGSPNARCC
jgi:beta-galactosidase/beta-glucuronidase